MGSNRARGRNAAVLPLIRGVLQRGIREFLEAVDNVESRASYAERLGWLARGVGVDGVEGLLAWAERDGEALSYALVEWVKRARQEVSGNRIRGILSALSTALSFYGLESKVRWKRVRMAAPPARKTGSDRAPTRPELAALLEVCGVKLKLAVTAMCSGGFRVGAWDYLRVGDVTPVEQAGVRVGRIVIYHGEPEEYVTFLSPECMKYFDLYLEQRRSVGEAVTPKSPLLRDEWQWAQGSKHRLDPSYAKRLSSKTLRNVLLQAWWKTPYRQRGEAAFKMVHGFRKFFETNAALGISRAMDIEVLKGHRYNYYKPAEPHLMQEYVKALPHLTIFEQPPSMQVTAEKEDLRKQVERLEAEMAMMRKDSDEFRLLMQDLRRSVHGRVEIQRPDASDE